jgi:hypothetical protein
MIDNINGFSISSKEISNILDHIPAGDIKASTEFFSRFRFSQMLVEGNYFDVLVKADELYQLCKSVNEKAFIGIHKGGLFYWMGLASYLIHDFTSAIFYIDAAVSEDIKNDNSNISPAHLFLQLEGEDKRHFGKNLALDAESKVNKLIQQYNSRLVSSSDKANKLTIDDVRNYLLRPLSQSTDPGKRSLATTFITFFIEFDFRYVQFQMRNEQGTNESLYLHLFKGCLLFESLLKNNKIHPVKGRTLKPVSKELSGYLNLPKAFNISEDYLKDVYLKDDIHDDSISNAIITTGRLRNTLGHNIGWPDKMSTPIYLKCFEQIAISCLHAISTLYR